MKAQYISIVIIILLCLAGLYFFKRNEGFTVSTCSADKDCPVRFSCSNGSCASMRPTIPLA